MSEFITDFIHYQQKHQAFIPSKDFFKLLRIADFRVRVLFSRTTHEIYKQLETMVGADLGALPGDSHGNGVGRFIQSQEETLRAMYREAGFIE